MLRDSKLTGFKDQEPKYHVENRILPILNYLLN